MKIISIDPSPENNGVVYMVDGAFMWAQTLSQSVLLEELPFWCLSRAYIEQPALGAGADTGTMVNFWMIDKALREHFGDKAIHRISPGTWKPIAEARGWDSQIYPDLEDQHQRDAFMIYKYFAWIEQARIYRERKIREAKNRNSW